MWFDTSLLRFMYDMQYRYSPEMAETAMAGGISEAAQRVGVMLGVDRLKVRLGSVMEEFIILEARHT